MVLRRDGAKRCDTAWADDARLLDPPLTGLDVGELAPDGRLRKITGFFGELPVAA
jgi:hypothetical protein